MNPRLLLSVLFFVSFLTLCHSIEGRVVSYRRHAHDATRWPGWYGNRFGWPSYYAYYGYPIQGSIYYYSFPTNSSWYYSYPSYVRDWTYPSYPYVGKYYINDTPVPAYRLRSPYRYPRTVSVFETPRGRERRQIPQRTGVFIGE